MTRFLIEYSIMAGRFLASEFSRESGGSRKSKRRKPSRRRHVSVCAGPNPGRKPKVDRCAVLGSPDSSRAGDIKAKQIAQERYTDDLRNDNIVPLSPCDEHPDSESVLTCSRMQSPILTDLDVEHFLKRGYVRIPGCFSRELCFDLTARACERLFCSIDDPATWPSGCVRPPESQRVTFESIAPKAWQAACELVGGADRVLTPCTWGDSFIINFGRQPELEWRPPSGISGSWQNWHKDGDFFRHFLDSPEQGLLVIGVFSDIEPRGGGTYLACDSVGHVARYLAAHPEGLSPLGTPAFEIVAKCNDFVEATGSIGDVYLLHPFMLHSQSVNASNRARFIVNPPVKLREPMCFSRGVSSEHSPVEQAILRALGVELHVFVPTQPREEVVPEQLQREREILDERARRVNAEQARD
jgi:hypothetical protein